MERLLEVIIGLVSILALACMIVIGEDVLHARRGRAHWRRRIIAAALLVLSLFGLKSLFFYREEYVARSATIMCYFFFFMPPDTRPRLEMAPKRLDLLKRCVDRGALDPSVVEKTVRSIEADRDALLQEMRTGKMSSREHKRADRLIGQIESALKEMKNSQT